MSVNKLRIDELRRLRGMTKVALAEAIGISRTNTNKLLDGTNWPSEDTWFALARALGVNPWELHASAPLTSIPPGPSPEPDGEAQLDDLIAA